MKKMLFLLLGAAAVSAFGETTPTEAVLGGEIGVTAITSSLQNTIVAVSYDDLDPSVTSGIAISNLVKTANLDVGDQLAVYVKGEYTTWTLAQDGETKAKYWAKNSKTFKIVADGGQVDGIGPSASDVAATVGTGIWLWRQTPPTGSFTFYIYGKPSTAITIKTKPGVWNLVGNPTQDNVPITDTITVGAKDLDTILVPAAAGLVTYLYKAGKGWRAAKDASGNWGAAPTVVAGTGFWIMTTDEVEIKW